MLKVKNRISQRRVEKICKGEFYSKDYNFINKDNQYSLSWRSIIGKEKLDEDELLDLLISEIPSHESNPERIDVIYEHVKYALMAKKTFSWGDQISNEVFIKYILPPCILKEPIEKWRKIFYEELYPRVKYSDSITETALKVNRWAAERVKYKNSSCVINDKSPLKTLRDTHGSCADLTILYVAACRAVSVPARATFVPWLTQRHEGVHIWTEIWDGRWHYVGSSESLPFNRTWFSWYIGSVAKVYTFSYYKTDKKLIIPVYPDLWIEDITNRYTDTKEVRIKVTNGTKAVAGCKVFFAVQNSDDSWKPVACSLTNNKGWAEELLGVNVKKYYVYPEDASQECGKFISTEDDRKEKTSIFFPLTSLGMHKILNLIIRWNWTIKGIKRALNSLIKESNERLNQLLKRR